MPSIVRWKFSRRLRKAEQGNLHTDQEKVHANGRPHPSRIASTRRRAGVQNVAMRCDSRWEARHVDTCGKASAKTGWTSLKSPIGP